MEGGKNVNVLITGGAGFIGSNLVKRLLQQNNGYNITVLDDLSTGTLENISPVLDKINFIEGNILDTNVLEKACRNIDHVFHLAARVSVEESISDPLGTNMVNLNGTVNLLECARRSRTKRLVFSSSAAVYGDTTEFPIKETTAVNPLSPYALQKYSSEQYCRHYSNFCGVETVCLRYFNVYGPNQRENNSYAGIIYRFIYDGSKTSTVRIDGDGLQTRDFVYVDDVVDANILSLRPDINASGQSYNIGTGKETSVMDLYKVTVGALKKDISIKYAQKRPGDIRRSCSNIEKAISGLGYSPKVTLTDGISRTYDWVINK
jgi:UDP-glucose 4-epimerase